MMHVIDFVTIIIKRILFCTTFPILSKQEDSHCGRVKIHCCRHTCKKNIEIHFHLGIVKSQIIWTGKALFFIRILQTISIMSRTGVKSSMLPTHFQIWSTRFAPLIVIQGEYLILKFLESSYEYVDRTSEQNTYYGIQGQCGWKCIVNSKKEIDSQIVQGLSQLIVIKIE